MRFCPSNIKQARAVGAGLLIILAICPALLLAAAAPAATVTDRPLLFSFDGSDATAGRFTNPRTIAIDEESGTVYVINTVGLTQGPDQFDDQRVVDKFNADGEAQSFASTGDSSLTGTETPGGAFGVLGFFQINTFYADITVDNSGVNPGRIYVSEETGPVHAFDAEGSYLWTLPQTKAKPCGMAVDGKGHLWVGDETTRKVLEFASSGSPPALIGSVEITSGIQEPCRIGFDSDNDLYVAQRFGVTGATVDKYAEVSPGKWEFISVLDPLPGRAIAIDHTKAAGHIFVAHETNFAEFDSVGSELESSPFGVRGELIGDGRGIAYDPSLDRVYVSDDASKTVKVYGPLRSGTVPDVTTKTSTEVDRHEAVAHATINPLGVPNSYHFEWKQCTSAECSAPADASWATAASEPEPWPGIEPPDSTEHSVAFDIEGLKSNSWYQARLVGTNSENRLSSYSAPDTFKTLSPPPPSVSIEPVSAITTTSAHLAATIDPREDETSWRILRKGEPDADLSQCKGLSSGGYQVIKEGTIEAETLGTVEVEIDLTGLKPAETSCVRVLATNSGGSGSADEVFITDAVAPSELETAFTAPRTDTTARINGRVNPNGEADFTYHFELSTDGVNWSILSDRSSSLNNRERVMVGEELSGLDPETIYYYRLGAAENEAGPATGPGEAETFTTRPTPPTAEPCPNEDVRAEQHTVYLPECRGIEMVNSVDKGNQNINTLDLHNITDDGGEAVWSVNGGAPGAPNTTANAFLATRGAEGWHSHAISPPAAQQYGGGDFLSQVRLASPDLTHFAAVYVNSPAQTLARLDQSRGQELLRSYPSGGLEQTGTAGLELSDDGAHLVVLNGETGQLEDAGEATLGPPEVAPKVVSIMPDGKKSACGLEERGWSFGGTDEGNSGAATLWHPGYRMIGADASRVYFQARPNNASDPSKCEEAGLLGLYVRNREANKGKGKTTLIDAGTGEEPHFIRAAADGRSAYFSTSSKLDPADENSDEDVYRWEEAKGESICLTCEATADAKPLRLGGRPAKVLVSDDGSHIYFQSNQKLAPEASGGHTSIYVLNDGAIRFVADTNDGEGTPLREGVQLSADGRVLVFLAKPTPGLSADAVASQCPGGGGTSVPCKQLYRYDDGDGSLECISCRRGGITTNAAHGAEISSDGSTIAFTTAEALVAEDVNNDDDVYEWREGRLALITDGLSERSEALAAAPQAWAIDEDGTNVFFAIAQPGLTGFEQDGLSNLYDARIVGGFEPQAPPPRCEGDSCQGPLVPPPSLDQAASAGFNGSGNVNEGGGGKPRCAKGKVRHRGHCVKRNPRKHHKRAAKAGPRRTR